MLNNNASSENMISLYGASYIPQPRLFLSPSRLTFPQLSSIPSISNHTQFNSSTFFNMNANMNQNL